MSDDNTLVLLVAVVVLVGFFLWIMMGNKREGYADQVLHAASGQVAGIYPHWNMYPEKGWNQPSYRVPRHRDPYNYVPQETIVSALEDPREAQKRLTPIGTGGVDVRKACNNNLSIAKHRFATAAGLKPLESME